MTEISFNTALGNALKRAMPEWRDDILIERAGTTQESPGGRPGILVTHHSIPPVAIAVSANMCEADADAKARLGTQHAGSIIKIQTAIAVAPPKDLCTSELPEHHTLLYALHQAAHRFPESDFMRGDIYDLARLVSTAAATREEVERVGEMVADNVRAAASILEPAIKMEDLTPHILYRQSALPGLRTTMILWLNALRVQYRLHGGTYDIHPMTSIPGECLKAWEAIHSINWRAIFKPAMDILDHARRMAPAETSEALSLLMQAVERMETARLGDDINIGAEIFPKMTEDRKESAAFYTQPAAAELLAALTVTPDICDWSDQGLFQRLRIADMACGTGTLLRFGYRQVKSYHRSARHGSGDLHKLHQDAMEYGLVGTDISPIAAHLTSTGLAVDARLPYGHTNIGWVGVGNENRTGAIEYIATDVIQDLMMDTIGRSAGQDGHTGYNSVTIKDQSIDIILMNPPYSRTRIGHSAFDIAGLSERERKACQERWGRLIRDEPCTKTAGMAATFLCLARKKVKPGGRIGFVLPRTAAFAEVWERTRDMLECDFEDIMAVAVASGRALGRKAFSADTGMEEMLLVATRKNVDDGKRSPVMCVTLYEPVTRIGEAAEVARAIQRRNDGQITVGSGIGVAKMFRTRAGQPWSSVGVMRGDVTDIADNLAQGDLLDLRGEKTAAIKMTTLGDLFGMGPTHHLIGHVDGSRYPTGAFTIHSIVDDADAAGKYRSLWNVNSKRQTRMVVLPTQKCIVYDEARADRMWESRSTLFYCRKTSWASYVVAAMTTHAAMGGNLWISLQHKDSRILKAFALWANSIYGMLIYWSRGSRTHPGRSMLEVRAMRKVPCPDFGQFGDALLDWAAAEFDRLSALQLLPARMAADDKTRAEINDAVSEMLGAPHYDTGALARLWCAEPSVSVPKRT